MKLISIELHNFRKFRNTPPIYFPEGIIGIIGNNGAGKSTIIEAIAWAIYGNRAARTRSKEQIKRQGAAGHEDCWVRLRFEMRGNEYEVLRIMGRNFSSDAQVKMNGKIVATTASGASKYLERVIGMDYESFFISIVAKQKELNALSDKTPGERKKNMLKMLKIDAVERAIKRVREDRRDKKYIMENMQKMLRNIEEMERNLEEALKNEMNMMAMAEEIGNRISMEEKNLIEIEREREAERQKAERHNELTARKKMLEGKMEEKIIRRKEKEKEIEGLRNAGRRYEEIKEYAILYDEMVKRKEEMEEIRIKYTRRRELIMQKKGIEREIEEMIKKEGQMAKMVENEKEIRRKKREIEEKIEEMRRNIQQIEKEIERKNAEIIQTMREKENLERKEDEIRKIGRDGKCPMCGRRLGEHFEELMKQFAHQKENMMKRIRENEEMVREKKGKIEKMERELNEMEEVMKKMEMDVKKIEEVKSRMRYQREIMEERRRKIASIKEEIEKIGEVEMDEEKYREIVERVKELEKFKTEAIKLQNEIRRLPLLVKELEKLDEEIKEIRREINEVMKKIVEISFDKSRYEMIEFKYKEKRDVIEKLKMEKMKIESNINYIKMEIQRLEKEIEEERKREEEIKKLRKEIANLELLEDLLAKFKNYMIAKISPSLSFYASHFFSIFTGGKYDNIEIDDDYNIHIYDRGEKFPINRFSGGEEDLANLALRLAISELIARRADVSFEFIALDEVFGSQDIHRRRNVLNALNELRKQFKQILLITHIEDIKDEMEHVIRVYEDDEGISRIKIE